MRIARFTEGGRTRLGLVDGDEVADVGTADPTLPTEVAALLAVDGLSRIAEGGRAAARFALDEVRLEAPITAPPEFLAIGLNYADHVAESGRDRPAAPIVFNKQITCITGPFDP